MVIEGNGRALAREITTSVKIRHHRHRASPACDGQILVFDDMLGLFNEFKPRFVKHFAESPMSSTRRFRTMRKR